jgi:trigger factor
MADTETQVELQPKVTIEDVGPARKCLTIEVPAEQIVGKIEHGFEQLNTDAVIPGFRKGHAPRQLIEKRFGAAVRDDARAQIIGEAYDAAIKAESLDVIGEPDVKDHEDIVLPEDGPLVFKVEVEVAPDVTLPDFEKLEVEKVDKPVTDADIDAELDAQAMRHGEPRTITEGQVEEKDYVQVDCHILAGENADEDAEVLEHRHDVYALVHGEDYDFKGHVAGIMIPDLGKQLAGKKVGDEVAISQTGPESHENEKIREQPITIKLNLKQIQRIDAVEHDKLPALIGFETLDELKDRIRQSLQERHQREQQVAMHEQVTRQLDEQVQLDLPEGMTQRQAQRVLQRKAMEMAYTGASEDQIAEAIAEMRGSSEEEARRQLKLFFIMDKAAKDMDIDVSEGEINGRIAMLAMQQGRRPEKLRQQMIRNGELEHLYLSIREQKTLDQIVGKAQVKQIDGPAEPGDDSATNPTDDQTKA